MNQDTLYDLVVIGGGAAGFFTAIQTAERRPDFKIIILEKSNKVLSKVKVSGGGRCNVTHACFDPSDMVTHYPRGRKELLGPFHRFLCGDMMAWLHDHGVETKIEEDGRVFPTSDSSQSIINCFLDQCRSKNIAIEQRQGVKKLSRSSDGWQVETDAGVRIRGKHVMVATGSTPSVWNLLHAMGYGIVDPVPSLFTFNIQHKLIKDLPGLSVPHARVEIKGKNLSEYGPLLITHWGLSGPGILKLSAWGARQLHELNYRFDIIVNWAGMDASEVRSMIDEERRSNPTRVVKKYPQLGISRRFWERFCYMARLYESNWASLSRQQMDDLVMYLCNCEMRVEDKSTFKEEFVTCGGVDTRHVDFRTMQSKLHEGLYFAGEVINVDAITGGFNFQAAWTEAFIAAEHISSSI